MEVMAFKKLGIYRIRLKVEIGHYGIIYLVSPQGSTVFTNFKGTKEVTGFQAANEEYVLEYNGKFYIDGRG